MSNQEQNPEILKEQEELREKTAATSAKIQAVLEEDGMALQPFLAYSEFGIVPSVRLVVNPINDGETNSEGDVEEGGESDGATEPEQS